MRLQTPRWTLPQKAALCKAGNCAILRLAKAPPACSTWRRRCCALRVRAMLLVLQCMRNPDVRYASAHLQYALRGRAPSGERAVGCLAGCGPGGDQRCRARPHAAQRHGHSQALDRAVRSGAPAASMQCGTGTHPPSCLSSLPSLRPRVHLLHIEQGRCKFVAHRCHEP